MYGGSVVLPHPLLVEYNSASIWASNFDYQLIVTITKFEKMTVTKFLDFPLLLVLFFPLSPVVRKPINLIQD